MIALTAWLSDFHDYQLATLGAYLCAIAGLTVLTGSNGQVSLGHAALMAIGGYTVALLQTRFADDGVTGVWVLPVSLLAGVVVTAVAGAHRRGRRRPAARPLPRRRHAGPRRRAAVDHLALLAARSRVTRACRSRSTGRRPGSAPTSPSSTGKPGSACSRALVVLFFLANLDRSAFGRHMRAVRDDEIASPLCGSVGAPVQVLAFAISAAAAGLGGGVLAVVLQTASPGSFDLVLSLTLLTAAVIGGLGSLTGAVLGVHRRHLSRHVHPRLGRRPQPLHRVGGEAARQPAQRRLRPAARSS